MFKQDIDVHMFKCESQVLDCARITLGIVKHMNVYILLQHGLHKDIDSGRIIPVDFCQTQLV